MSANPSAAVLVASSDGYRDLWRPFFELLDRYWPQRAYPVYLATNEAGWERPGVRVIRSGPDRDWSSSFRAILEQIEETWLVVLLEDYLVTAPVDARRLDELVRYAAEQDATCLRLAPVPGAAAPLAGSPAVGELPRGEPYRLSLQAAIWHRERLLDLLRDGESAWELELIGSSRTADDDHAYLSVLGGDPWPIPYFCTAVVRGRWLRDAIALCRREGVPIDLDARPRESLRAYARRRARLGRFRR